MLVVYSTHVPVATKRCVALSLIRNIILATHCANLTILPGSPSPGSTVTIPVVPLCIPAPEVFPQLSTFLYAKRIDHLLASLLPYPLPHPPYCNDSTSEGLFKHFASNLAMSHTTQVLLTYATTVNGLWRNTCTLGIDNEKL